MTDEEKAARELALTALDAQAQADELMVSDKADANTLARFLNRQWTGKGNSADDIKLIQAIVERRTEGSTR